MALQFSLFIIEELQGTIHSRGWTRSRNSILYFDTRIHGSIVGEGRLEPEPNVQKSEFVKQMGIMSHYKRIPSDNTFPDALATGLSGQVRETHCSALILIMYQLGTIINISKL